MDSNFLLSGSDDETIMIWSMETLNSISDRSSAALEQAAQLASPSLIGKPPNRPVCPVTGQTVSNDQRPINLGPAFDVRFVGKGESNELTRDCKCPITRQASVFLAAPDERNFLSVSILHLFNFPFYPYNSSWGTHCFNTRILFYLV